MSLSKFELFRPKLTWVWQKLSWVLPKMAKTWVFRKVLKKPVFAVLHSVWPIRNAAFFKLVLFLNFSKKMTSAVHYLFPIFWEILDSLFLILSFKLHSKKLKSVEVLLKININRWLGAGLCRLCGFFVSARQGGETSVKFSKNRFLVVWIILVFLV